MEDMPLFTQEKVQDEVVMDAAVGKASELLRVVKETESHRSDEERKDIAKSVLEMVVAKPELVNGTYSGAIKDCINEIIGSLDNEISLQLDQIIHAKPFQQLEATWRGLAQMVCETETSDLIKINVFDVSKGELEMDLVGGSMTKPDIFQTHLFQKIQVDGYGSLAGKPYGLVIGDYEFTPTFKDMEILRGIAQVSATAQAPFISAASPAMFDSGDYTRLTTPIALDEMLGDNGREKWKHWRIFREDENSRYVGLVLPHVLMRAPFEHDANNRKFTYKENVSGDVKNYLWGNAAWAYGSCVLGAFDAYSWCTAIRGYEGGLIHLTDYTFERAGLDVTVGPTDIKIDLGREQELSGYGFLPLVKVEGRPQAVFLGGQSCQKPKQYYEDEPAASAELSARLPYIFAVSRFAHYLKARLYRKIGSFTSRDLLEADLKNWIGKYILNKPNATHKEMAEFPLLEASVEVKDGKKPGYYEVVARLRPHYQLERVEISLRLVASVKKPA
jgi:type VI secretion system protein ImpC